MPSILDSLRPLPPGGLNLPPETWEPARSLIPVPEPLTRYLQAQETAKARLAAHVAIGVPQDRVDAMLAEEAGRECGIPTNISASAMERVADRLSRPRAMTAGETVDYLNTLHVPRSTPEQRASAREVIERLKATARDLGVRVEFARAPEPGAIAVRAAGDGWMYAGTDWHEGDLFSVRERLPGKTSLAFHVAKHREGPGPRVGFRVSLDTLLATAEGPAR